MRNLSRVNYLGVSNSPYSADSGCKSIPNQSKPMLARTAHCVFHKNRDCPPNECCFFQKWKWQQSVIFMTSVKLKLKVVKIEDPSVMIIPSRGHNMDSLYSQYCKTFRTGSKTLHNHKSIFWWYSRYKLQPNIFRGINALGMEAEIEHSSLSDFNDICGVAPWIPPL